MLWLNWLARLRVYSVDPESLSLCALDMAARRRGGVPLLLLTLNP